MQRTIGQQCGISAWKIGETDNKLVMDTVGAFIAAARGDRRERYLSEVLGWIPSVVDYVRKPFIVDWYQRLADFEGRAGASGRSGSPGREVGRGRGWWA